MGRLVRAACVVAIVLGVGVAIYLTDRRSPDLRTIEWLPKSLHGIVLWADYHGRFRNTPAYGLLALPFLILLRTPRQRIVAMLAVAVFATVMEYSQLFIPTRVFDWYDIVESWLGQAIAWVLMEAVYWVIGRLTRPKRTSLHVAGSPTGGVVLPRLGPNHQHAPIRKHP